MSVREQLRRRRPHEDHDLAVEQAYPTGGPHQDAWRIAGTVGNKAFTGLVQRAARRSQGAGPLAPGIEAEIRNAQGGGHPLPDSTRADMESHFGVDFSAVRIHTDSTADTLSQSVQANAFTTGTDIFFRSGEYAPASSDGRTVLAHELTHVIQQSSGTVPADSRVSHPADPEEIEAQRVARSVVSDGPIPMARERLGAVSQSPRHSPVQRDSTDVHAELTGHASPIWEHTHGASRSELNLRLSEDRVEEVQLFFEEMLGNALRERGLDADITYTCRNVEQSAPVGSADTTSLSADAVGHSATEVEAGGDTRANRPDMRRVDLKVTVTWQVEGAALSSESEEVTIPEECEPNATDEWAVKLALSGGAGHAGLGVAGALGTLKNRMTGQTAQGSFQGGGIGIGLSTPGADPGWSDWSDFTTDSRVTFEDFDGTLTRLTTAGVGISLIGYSLAYISFPTMGANSIDVGGFNMGALGADAGSNVGTWNVIGTPPGPVCHPEHTEHREVIRSDPYNTAMPHEFHHRVLFDTGSAEISDAELVRIQEFVDLVMVNYEYTGVLETRLPT